MNTSEIGLYLHIPFCKNKCHYCDFYTLKYQDQLIEQYTQALIKQIHLWGNYVTAPVDTIYFGGGTPSLLSPRQVFSILEAIQKTFTLKKPEITMEMNPENLTYSYCSNLFTFGINRISIGIQSTQDHHLKKLGRTHDIATITKGVEQIQNAGFTNISGDIILGNPDQTEADLKQDFQFLANHKFTHISLYLLKIEKGTKFYQNKLVLCDNTMADQYLNSLPYLESLGFHQYEISNFAKQGFSSKHNEKYWKNHDYIGIGPSAHSLYKKKRFSYRKEFKNFLSSNNFSQITYHENLALEDMVIFPIRLKEGVLLENIKNINPNFNTNQLTKLKDEGLLYWDKDRLFLTGKGFLLSNQILGFLLK